MASRKKPLHWLDKFNATKFKDVKLTILYNENDDGFKEFEVLGLGGWAAEDGLMDATEAAANVGSVASVALKQSVKEFVEDCLLNSSK